MARELNKLPEDCRIWKKGGEKPMSAYEGHDHDKVEAGKAKSLTVVFRKDKGPANRTLIYFHARFVFRQRNLPGFAHTRLDRVHQRNLHKMFAQEPHL
jgi:hypothetical protein